MHPGEMEQLESKEFNDKTMQSARSFLRERFLRLVTKIVGSDCSLHMYSNTTVSGVFKGGDIEFSNILVEKLKTPFAEIPHAMIRASDIHYIEF